MVSLYAIKVYLTRTVHSTRNPSIAFIRTEVGVLIPRIQITFQMVSVRKNNCLCIILDRQIFLKVPAVNAIFHAYT